MENARQAISASLEVLIMINIFIAGMVGVMSFIFFNLGININSINRIIINTPKQIFESSTYLVDEETPYIYFNEEKLLEQLTNYYSNSFEKYVDDFELKLYFLNASDKTFCLNSKCNYVKVEIKAYLFLDYTFDQSIFYEIRGEYRG